jgi:hypothetical protein
MKKWKYREIENHELGTVPFLRLLGRQRRRWVDNIKMDLEERG